MSISDRANRKKSDVSLQWSQFQIAITPLFLFLMLPLLCPAITQAFPDTARFGYTHCASCHVNPSGGGLLNDYGRSLSSELMSTWSRKNEELRLHGMAGEKTSLSFLNWGGDVRYLNREAESKTSRVSEGFLMQAQAYLAATFKNWTAYAAVGELENPRQSKEIKVQSPQYFLLGQISDSSYLKVGRFTPTFGLRMPDHNLWIKSETTLAPWIKRDGAEVITQTELSFLSITGFQGLSSADPNTQTTGYAAHVQYQLHDLVRLGVSYLTQEGQNVRSKTYSFSGLLSTKSLHYLLFEFDRIEQNGSEKWVGFVRPAYHITKGLAAFLQGQLKDIQQTQSYQRKWGGGVMWLPRPHLVWQIVYEKTLARQKPSDEVYSILQYYF